MRRTKTGEKTGSMPDEQSAIILIVPVGAIQVMAALRTFLFLLVRQTLSFQFGKGPR